MRDINTILARENSVKIEDYVHEQHEQRSRLFGVTQDSKKSELAKVLHDCFRRWDTREIRGHQFIREVECRLGRPVETELEKYVHDCDEGRYPSSFRDFMKKLFEGKNSLANLQAPRQQTEDSAKAIIHDNSGVAKPQVVSGNPIVARTDLHQDDFIRAAASFQGRPRRTNQTSYDNPVPPMHETTEDSGDVETLIRLFINMDLKEHEFRQLIEKRGIVLNEKAERAIRIFVSSGEGTFAALRRCIR